MSFETLGLTPRLLAGVASMGYTSPTPIQLQAIPEVLAGRDVVGVAQTGTGKTAAFVLPLLQRTPRRQGIRALVVTPTRELALQIGDVIKGAARQTGHRYAVVHGGVGYQPQADRIRKGVDIVVATPGRLLDLHSQRDADLSKVEVLVLDEADRMLDMGFLPDVRRILALLPARRQNLLFSATMSPGVLKVVADTLHEPVRVEVTPPSTPVERIGQAVYPVSSAQKTELLVHMLADGAHRRTLVFTRTKHRADRLQRQLERKGLAAGAIHGDRSQAQRQRALDAFKAGKSNVLVATDVVARGIDVEDITHVVNYDMPGTAEEYVHRIGRTARAGASGKAISFLSEEEAEKLAGIEKALGSTIVCEDVDGFHYSERHVPDPDRHATPPIRSGKPAPATGEGRRRRRHRRGR